MSSFLNWFFSFITTMFGSIWQGIVGFVKGIIKILDFKTYFQLFSTYSNGFGFFGWIFAILALIFVYVFWACIVYLIYLFVRKRIDAYKSVKQNEDLLDEIANLHRDMDRLIKEKEKIIEMKYAPNVDFASYMKPEEGVSDEEAIAENESVNVDESATMSNSRFYRLTGVDEKYAFFTPEPYQDDITLKDLCDEIRNFACYNSKLYYEIKIIRLAIAGLASTKIVLLQGISGTGKTSLPYIIGKYLTNDATIASVQPSWRDRTELFGFFNEFTKKFNETEVLSRIYEASYNDNVNLIILDEMNIARVEYYFAEMLSILEMPDPNEWKIQLVSAVWEDDPKHLEAGKLSIPQNVFYVGTANNDDSTFAVSDKVYDRAFVINLDSKGVPFEPVPTEPRRLSYSKLASLYEEAIAENPVTDQLIKNIEKLDLYVIEHFRVAFGNRIMKQLHMFVPVYIKCGGQEYEAVDYMLATKVFRKFESLNLALIRDEIKGLINQLDTIFGKGKMVECISFLQRLQKSY